MAGLPLGLPVIVDEELAEPFTVDHNAAGLPIAVRTRSMAELQEEIDRENLLIHLGTPAS